MTESPADDGNTEPRATETTADDRDLTVVGIGASAGGLEALRAFVGHLPAGTSMAYIIAQHLSPRHESMLVQLLGRETRLRVAQVADGMAIDANTIYITPANKNIVVEGEQLRLTEPEDRPVPKPSVDGFFRSLADAFGEHAIAVVLSGTGSDGSHGVRAIKAGGGFTLVQAPETAKYDGMPRAAMETGCIDLVMPPDRIAGELQRLVEMAGHALLTQPEQPEAPVYERITRLIHQQAGLDLSAYKEKTVHRRLRRRMATRHLDQLEDYLQLLEEDPQEVGHFCQDILISVTSFFRDPEAFEALREQLYHLLRNRRPGDDIRIWVPGCATGEEAYTLAILLSEMLGSRVRDYRIQVFATDLDEPALNVARRGIYSATSLVELDEETINRYFQPYGDQYKVVKSLREMLVFARQDLLHDPPFLRLDLLSCRNLLIYFNSDTQKRLFELFHYAVNPGGLLFLGKSENVTRHEHLFLPLESTWKIFQQRGSRSSYSTMPYRASGGAQASDDREPAPRPRPKLSPYDRMIRATMEQYAPAGLLVDETLQIQHILGDTSRYLRIPHGDPDFTVRNLVRQELRVDLSALVTRVKKDRVSAFSRSIHLPEHDERVRVSVHPVTGELDEELLYLICFDPVPAPADDEHRAEPRNTHTVDDEASQQRINELEDELATTREHLQTVIEELETTNEELQSSNEELQSSNEELQSSNEELETTNEELQSTNEELTTVNEELNSKTDELNAAYNDLRNVNDSLVDPLVVVDEGLRIKFHNQACDKIFIGTDGLVDTPLLDVERRVDIPRFRQRLQRVIRHGEQVEVQISQTLHTAEEGAEHDVAAPVMRYYLLRMQPYYDEQRNVGGAVITFFDNTRIKRAERGSRESEARLHAIVNRSPVLTALKDPEGRYILANAAFESWVGLEPGGALGRRDTDLLPADVASRNGEREQAALNAEEAREHEESVTLSGQTRHFITERFPLLDEDGHVYALCIKALDITERRATEEKVRLQSKALDASMNGILIAEADDPELPIVYANPAFERITGYSTDEVLQRNCRFLQGPETDQVALDVVREALRDGTNARVLLRNYRKDGSPFWNDLSIFPVHDEEARLTHFVGIQEDATKRVDVERALRDNEERLITAQDYAGVANFEWRPDAVLLGTPGQLADLFGLPPSAGGQPSVLQLLRRVHPNDRAPLLDAIRQCLRSSQDVDLEFRVRTQENGLCWLHIRANAERGNDGSPLRLLGLVGDISRRKDVENALLSARLEAEKANRAKSEFLSHMSHELRTPLNAILGFAQLLEADPDNPVSPAQNENIQQILRAGWHLLDLISEVLDLARIESGRLNVENQPLDLHQVVNDSLRTVSPMAEERRVSLHQDIRFRGELVSDTTRVTQVLLNLLTNAIKYNHEGGDVHLSAWDDGQRLWVAIADTGIGIPREDRGRLFESFNRLGQEGGRIQGTGIGLVLVHRILQLLGGTIDVESTPDQGSTFTFNLPLIRPEAVAAIAEEEPAVVPHEAAVVPDGHRPLRVLYVEDNPSNMALAREIFRREASVELLEATDGNQGVVMAAAERPDLILMDLHLPGMTGQQALEALRADSRTAGIPVIAVTADALYDEATAEAGFNDRLTKPLRIRDLQAALQHAVAR
ncbi:chemotaxis protein CheB [Aquisalimonas asiatica]|uniref:Two-component system, chemotaxis family, CheB/CheR fusion protein n=1 Tax=Aquisalimonas asiatica TaxID=406100 RepID=A0A1H8QR19_9GAMM|nr:chemotaxis protein CheB [Aquisalimonas asiatica]SEO56670.1 two-component system, chemotaxis family, CheB/CheR fusion protein [Aquisalimonas asiatica]